MSKLAPRAARHWQVFCANLAATLALDLQQHPEASCPVFRFEPGQKSLVDGEQVCGSDRREPMLFAPRSKLHLRPIYADRQIDARPEIASGTDARWHLLELAFAVVPKAAPLQAKYRAWLALMRAAHNQLTATELADRLGVRPEVFSRPKRPGLFTSTTLDGITEATGLPAWLIVQAIELGRVIELPERVPIGKESA